MIPIRKVPLAAVVAALAGAGSSPQPFYHTLVALLNGLGFVFGS